jgi:Lon protease-like protein
MSDPLTSLSGFSGVARLFPLPNLVLFPFVIQPLHVFEPRYRELMQDALQGDRLIALALLQPGWEGDYHKAPPIHPVICIGRIFQEQRLPDGRWNLLLHGLARARVEEELETEKRYRTARVTLLHDMDPPAADAQPLRRELGRRMTAWLSTQGSAQDQLQKLLESSLPLGALCDIFVFALPIDVEVKQRLLEEVDVGRRVSLLIDHLDAKAPSAPAKGTDRKFPPEFSPN